MKCFKIIINLFMNNYDKINNWLLNRCKSGILTIRF